MKKRILIVHPSMEIGGAERALLGLLDSFDYSLYQVDLLLCGHRGDFKPLINENVNLLPYNKSYDFFQCPISQLLKNFQWRKAFLRLMAKYNEERLVSKYGYPHSVWHSQQLIHKYISPFLPDLKEHYDLAINFLGIPSIITEHVPAKIKMTWIHTDYNRIIANADLDRKMYDKVDWIVNVSEDCKRVFDAIYPQYVEKSIIIENILNDSLVNKLSEEKANLPFTNEVTNLLSVGRFGEAKNFDSIPEICRIIVDSGITDFKWYIIGYGAGEQLIRHNIARFGVEENVIILGKKTNPYPYIKAADIYLQPSRFEGKAVTVREAQMLGKPVIVTAYDTAPSQIDNGVDGLILPMDNREFALGLYNVLKEKDKLKSLSNFCLSHNFGNENEIHKIYQRIP